MGSNKKLSDELTTKRNSIDDTRLNEPRKIY